MELFAGAGGLALGISNEGFEHEAVVEWDKDACTTLKYNTSWPIHHIDVNKFDFSQIKDDIDLLAGGPPCQPFSIGGKHKGFNDTRDMFPSFLKAVRELKPRAILIENVKGLLRESFSQYFEYIILQLNYPEITRIENENWINHLARLEQHHTSYRYFNGLTYKVVFRLLNAADYGVPQRRERVFIVAFREDLNVDWSFPCPTHSRNVLQYIKSNGEYWNKHSISNPQWYSKRVLEIQENIFEDALMPWRTVRDAISDLLESFDEKETGILNHNFVPGARIYPGHTGSQLDEPAKTLKAGVHGVPGGENMIAFSNGEVRYFTIREAARIQTFPDNFVFNSSWTESMRQLGNAVPMELAKILARSIAKKL